MGHYKLYFIETNLVLKQVLFGTYESFDTAIYWAQKYSKCLYGCDSEIEVFLLSDDCAKIQNKNQDDFFIIRQENDDEKKTIMLRFPKK